MLLRRAFLASGLASLAAPAFAADAPLTTVRIAGTPDTDIVATIYGVRSGIFSKLGLDVHVQKLNGGAAVSAAVIGGSIDIGKSNVFGVIAAHMKGVPLLLESLAATYSSDRPNVGFVVAKDSPIKSPSELNGKTLATPGLGDLFTQVSSAWIDQNGGDSHSVKFVELPMPLIGQAIASGRVDGALMVDPIMHDAVATGKVRIIGRPFDAIAKHFGITYYFCTRDYATKNADVLARFRRGVAQAAAYAMSHQSELVPLAMEYTGLSRTQVEDSPVLIGSGADPQMLQPVIDFAAKYKSIPNGFPARELFDPAALTA